MIEVLMTMALLLYFFAFYLARSFPQERWRHIFVACLAFALDVGATIKMFQMDLHLDNWLVMLHTYLGIIALSLFVVQGTLGIMRKRKQHIFFAKYVFLPTWVVSYSSGFLFLIPGLY